MKKISAFIALAVSASMVLSLLAPAFATDSTLPECQFSGPPTPAQLSACETASSQDAQSGQSSQPPSGSGVPDQPSGQMPNIDMSGFPARPSAPDAGPGAEFMGKPLAGEGASAMAGQLGAAFLQIQDGLLQAEDGIKQMKEGQIKIGDLENIIKQARGLYDKAQDAYKAENFEDTAKYLKELQALNIQARFAAFEQNAISADLIADVKKQMQEAIKSIEKMPNDPEFDETKTMLLTSLDKVGQAEALLNKGDKKGAAGIMKELRKNAPDAGAAEMNGKMGGLSPKKLGQILDKIKEALARAERGIIRTKEMGIEPTAEESALLEKAKTLYDSAQTAFDADDIAGAAAKLADLGKMNLEEKFTAFKTRVLPPERQDEILGQIASAIKALELTILHAKEYGIATDELEALLTKVKGLYDNAKIAKTEKKLETFLTLVDDVDSLKLNDKVNAIIRKLAQEKAEGIAKEGIEKIGASLDELKISMESLAKRKVDMAYANSLRDEMNKAYQKAKTAVEKEDYIEAGKRLDDAVGFLLPLLNIFIDSGVKLADAQIKEFKTAINFDKDTEGMTFSPDKKAKLQAAVSAMDAEDVPSLKGTLSNFNPDLLDRVISARDKDKKFIDAIMKDVMPLIPEKDRIKTMEGELGLFEESKAAEKTVVQLKKIKGMPADVIAGLEQLKEQVKKYDFPPGIATQIDKKLTAFNDKVASGEIKSTLDIKNYVKVLKEDVQRSINQAKEEKFKKGLIPAKNIDNTSAYFTEMEYLENEGAVKADKLGNINLDQKIDGPTLSNLLSATMDKKIAKISAGQKTTQQAVKAVLDSYRVKPQIDLNNAQQVSTFMKNIGVNIDPLKFKKPATLGVVADIIAGADQRYGRVELR